MIEAAPHLKMGFVNKAAGSIQLLIGGQRNCNLLPVRKPEKLFVTTVNEANIISGSFNILVEPFGDIAETVEVIVSLLGVAANQEKPPKIKTTSTIPIMVFAFIRPLLS